MPLHLSTKTQATTLRLLSAHLLMGCVLAPDGSCSYAAANSTALAEGLSPLGGKGLLTGKAPREP